MRPHLSLLPWQPLFEHQQNILCLLSSEKLCSHNRGPCCTITTKALEEGRAGDREVPTPARAMLLMEQILPGKSKPQLPGQPLALVHSSSHPCRASMCLFGFKTGGFWVQAGDVSHVVQVEVCWAEPNLQGSGSVSVSPDQQVLNPRRCEGRLCQSVSTSY